MIWTKVVEPVYVEASSAAEAVGLIWDYLYQKGFPDEIDCTPAELEVLTSIKDGFVRSVVQVVTNFSEDETFVIVPTVTI